MNGKMKAIIKHDKVYGARMELVDIPTISQNEVLIKVNAVSICGTDLHIYKWDEWASNRVKPPYTFGHEFSGEVIEIGDSVTNVKLGDQVSGETHFVCYECKQCLDRKYHLCKQTKILGVDTNGCFAEYLALPSQNIWKNNKHINTKLASLQEPFGNAVQTVLASNIPAKAVAVIGCGPIGLMAIAVAKASGASKVIAIDINDYRLDIARKLKADFVYNSTKINIVSEIMKITNGDGVDVVCEMSGNDKAINQALKCVTNGGDFNILSLPTKPVSIDLTNDVVFKGIKIQGITGRKMYSTWLQTSELLSNDMVDLSSIVTHELDFDDFEVGFELMEKGECGKVILKL
jgi:threonine 3-dehydrogenase